MEKSQRKLRLIRNPITGEIEESFFPIRNKNITTLIIPKGIRTIPEHAFNGCVHLESIEIPDSVKTIEKGAFYNCISLLAIEIPDSVKNIGESAFRNCRKIKYIEMSDGVSTIENYTFYNCENLLSIIIPNSVQNIGEYAFYGCDKLKKVTIPDSVENIGEYAFYGCEKVTMSIDTVVQKNNFENSIIINERTQFTKLNDFLNILKNIIYDDEETYENKVKYTNEILTQEDYNSSGIPSKFLLSSPFSLPNLLEVEILIDGISNEDVKIILQMKDFLKQYVEENYENKRAVRIKGDNGRIYYTINYYKIILQDMGYFFIVLKDIINDKEIGYEEKIENIIGLATYEDLKTKNYENLVTNAQFFPKYSEEYKKSIKRFENIFL